MSDICSIYTPPQKQNLNDFLVDKVHYACGKKIFDGWLNVDAFDLSYPDGHVDDKSVGRIFYWNLVEQHPFPENYFRYGYSEDFLEHLTQAQSLAFLSECHRTFAPGGVLRLSSPSLGGILKRHFRTKGYENVLRGIHDAYTSWNHVHFYTPENLKLVGRELGFRKFKVCLYGLSWHRQLLGRDSRDTQQDLNLIVELTK